MCKRVVTGHVMSCDAVVAQSGVVIVGIMLQVYSQLELLPLASNVCHCVVRQYTLYRTRRSFHLSIY